MKNDLNSLIQLTSVSFTYTEILLNLLICMVSVTVILLAYVKFSHTTTNKLLFARVFPIYGIAIFTIITVIQSSLALSLGLVGALSIIRFRTAIKEPEQLIYLLMATAAAIGTGAGQYRLVIISVLLFLLVSIVLYFFTRDNRSNQDTLIISSLAKINLSELDSIVGKYSEAHALLNSKTTSSETTLTYHVVLDNHYELLEALRRVDKEISFTTYKAQ